jgi:SAM-dependent methyltransferase
MTHDDGDLLDLLDLDGEVLDCYWAEAIAWVRHAACGRPRRRLVDLGAGTGCGTIRLAERFSGAEVVAVDSSAAALDRVADKALALGLAPRVRTVVTDLDHGWPDLGPVDLTWASMSLHHLADPGRTLAELHAATRPDGLFAVADFAEPLRHLPADLAESEQRALDVLRDTHREELPHLGAQWADRLAGAGFEVIDERSFAVDVRPGRSAAAARYARLWLRRLLHGAGDRLAPVDRDALAGFRRWDELHVRGTRTVTLARRP